MRDKLKQLNKKNVKEVLSLYKSSIILLWRKIGRTYTKRGIKENVDLTLKKGKIFGYFINKKLVECIGIILDKKHSYADLYHVLVDERYQRRGIGTYLMKCAENYARGNKIKKARLHVLIKNPAVNFYVKQGYKKHAYIMEKPLK